MRARGLKHNSINGETSASRSRPMRARGLKREIGNSEENKKESRPMRARGLKHVYIKEIDTRIDVAPHAGAWVET